MSTGEILALPIESIAATGSGLARAKDRCVFVDFTAPGDTARIRITEEQKTWSRGELLEILEPSPQRIEPLCPLYGNCGGCNLAHINYDSQQNIKKEILKDCFSRIGGIVPPEIKLFSSPQWEYRNRVQFHCEPGNRKKTGFMARKGTEIIPLADCRIADPGIREALKNRNNERLFPPPEKDRFTVFSRGDLFLSEGGASRGRMNLGLKTKKNLLIDAGVFFQSNCGMLETLLADLETLAKNCDPDLLLGDIYCGAGTFSAFLGEYFRGIELVEENKTALALARENATGKDRRFYSLRADEWIKRRKYNDKPWGFMILDPPRTGLSQAMRRFLGACDIRTLAYVSCDPAPLARDSKDLIKAGFILEELSLYDFYPQTSHIESLAVFTKGKSGE